MLKKVLRDAIQQLGQIKNRVHVAAHIYGGHRGRADHYIDLAIAQLQQALKYENGTNSTDGDPVKAKGHKADGRSVKRAAARS